MVASIRSWLIERHPAAGSGLDFKASPKRCKPPPELTFRAIGQTLQTAARD